MNRKTLDKLEKAVRKAVNFMGKADEVEQQDGSVVVGDLIVTPLVCVTPLDIRRVRVQRGDLDMEDSYDKLPLMIDAAFGLSAGLQYLADRKPDDAAAQRKLDARQLSIDYPQQALHEYVKQGGNPVVRDTAGELLRELSARKLDYSVALVPGPKLRLVPTVAGPAAADIYYDHGAIVIDAAGVQHRVRGWVNVDEMASWLAPFSERVSAEADDEAWAKDIVMV